MAADNNLSPPLRLRSYSVERHAMKRFIVALAALSVATLVGIKTETASAAAIDLHFTENCYGWGADVKLKWTGQNPSATQYVDYTRLNQNFALGTFDSSGPLGGMSETFTAVHLTPNVPYQVRVNQFANGTWSASQTW